MIGIATTRTAGNSETGIGKAWLQRLLAVVLFMVLLPVIALVAVVVAVSLGRPLLFVQDRAGMNSSPFSIMKLRSLKDLYDDKGEPLPDEQRTNAISGILRRSRLDELPQLLCIARGQMAFVGPRPLLPETIRNLGELGKRRCAVRPGITGWAQVCGNTTLDDTSKVALDIWYIDHRSWRLDVRILAETLLTLMKGEKKVQARVDQAMNHLQRQYGWRPETGQNGEPAV